MTCEEGVVLVQYNRDHVAWKALHLLTLAWTGSGEPQLGQVQGLTGPYDPPSHSAPDAKPGQSSFLTRAPGEAPHPSVAGLNPDRGRVCCYYASIARDALHLLRVARRTKCPLKLLMGTAAILRKARCNSKPFGSSPPVFWRFASLSILAERDAAQTGDFRESWAMSPRRLLIRP
eukprot:CAMPEP_0204468358 /NCGR_PEP_ID=MMETSP0471-20130131/10464_1 /ASSEMBLY_ACC=CAM_ASM_000602 /TAXON_ID=2969 /ORGANISM="Oxyrrhis marina" /LENGTH=174 /DNA_ID=CAMNT_0051470167 /DNA_START=618 /DNA_END=1145 /DNA_ORIENTATION=-